MRTVGRWSVSSFLSVLLTVCWYGVILAMLAFAAIIVLSLWGVTELPGATISAPGQVTVDAQTFHISAPSLGIEDMRPGDLRGELMLTFHPPSALYAASIAAALIVPLAFVLFVLGQLRAIFRTLRNGKPFVPENATRIRRIAYFVISGALAQAVAAYAWNHHVKTHFSASGMRFEAIPDLDVGLIVLGLIIFVLAEVFRAGTRLDEDQSLTV